MKVAVVTEREEGGRGGKKNSLSGHKAQAVASSALSAHAGLLKKCVCLAVLTCPSGTENECYVCESKLEK